LLALANPGTDPSLEETSYSSPILQQTSNGVICQRIGKSPTRNA